MDIYKEYKKHIIYILHEMYEMGYRFDIDLNKLTVTPCKNHKDGDMQTNLLMIVKNIRKISGD